MIVTTLRRAMEQLDRLSGERAGLEEALKVGHTGGAYCRACCLLHRDAESVKSAGVSQGVWFESCTRGSDNI